MAGKTMNVVRYASIGTAVLAAAAAALLGWCYADVVTRVAVADKVVALTYDDGPNPPHTQALLAVLAVEEVPATFFLKGQNVDAFADIPRLIGEAGHEIANHSYYHQPMTSLRREAMRAEVTRVNKQLAAYPGLNPRLFRPPFGVQGPGLKLALADLGMISVIADVNGLDWELTDGEAIAGRVLEDVGPGSIILLHDGHGDTDQPRGQDSRAATVAATQIIITTLKEQGYRFVKTGELLAMASNN